MEGEQNRLKLQAADDSRTQLEVSLSTQIVSLKDALRSRTEEAGQGQRLLEEKELSEKQLQAALASHREEVAQERRRLQEAESSQQRMESQVADLLAALSSQREL